MRSVHRHVLFMAALALAGGACGGDGGTPPSNDPPVADFSFACTALACTFTDESTDPDGAADIDTYGWAFGGDGTSAEQSPAHTFSAAGAYDVALTVTDAAGETNTSTQTVTVSASPVNTPPTADFTFVCNAEQCTFTDASTDGDGTIASYAWDFGDGNTSTEADPVHTYTGITVLKDFDVALTVTDDDGDTDVVTKTVAVAPPAQTVCDNGSGTFVECGLTLTNAATVRVTITSLDCTADGNTLIITAPDPDETVFTDGCSQTAGDFFDLNNGAAYAAGTELRAQMISGSDDPNRIAPQLHVTGAYPQWTLEFDDGEDPTGPGEPDFNDIVMTVTATE
jgi:PKD repeat protein